METTPIKCIALAILLPVFTPHIRAQPLSRYNPAPKTETISIDSEPGQRAFLESYIAATNAKDAAKVRAMYHPEYLAALKKYIENVPVAPGSEAKTSLDMELLQVPVPADHPPFIVQRYLKDSPFPQAGLLGWPVPPTHFVQFSYDISPNGIMEFDLYVAHLGNRWFAVGGIPHTGRK